MVLVVVVVVVVSVQLFIVRCATQTCSSGTRDSGQLSHFMIWTGGGGHQSLRESNCILSTEVSLALIDNQIRWLAKRERERDRESELKPIFFSDNEYSDDHICTHCISSSGHSVRSGCYAVDDVNSHVSQNIPSQSDPPG